MNEKELLESIKPKSDQLNADDLIAGPLIVTVKEVIAGETPEQPVQIVIDGHRPYRPCKSMRRVLVMLWGANPSKWIGRSMRLYMDSTVKFGGQAVGGIRISHMSDIEGDKSQVSLTTARGRRGVFTVEKLTDAPKEYPQSEFDKNVTKWVQAIANKKTTVPELIQTVAKKGQLSQEQIADIEQRVKDLEA